MYKNNLKMFLLEFIIKSNYLYLKCIYIGYKYDRMENIDKTQRVWV